MNYNKSLKIKRKGGSMTPAKSAVRIPSGGSPLRRGSPFKRRRRTRLPEGHGRPTPGPRKPTKSPSWYKGIQRDPRRDPVRRKGRFRNQLTNRFKKRVKNPDPRINRYKRRRIRNRFIRKA